MSHIRLDKFLASQLNISRTDAKKLLRQGRVTMNATTVKNADCQVCTENDRVCVDTKDVVYKEHLYIMMNKPQGVVSASDGKGDVTVIDILPDNLKRQGLFPAGRLDKDTTGFVLITDDGDFAHDILSPTKHIPKTYIVTLERPVTQSEERLICNGMILDEKQLQPAFLRQLTPSNVYLIVIKQGLYHQIKRMFGATGNKVTALKRIAMGGLQLDNNLKPGESREIRQDELALVQSENAFDAYSYCNK